MNGVAEKAKIQNHHLFGATGSLEKAAVARQCRCPREGAFWLMDFRIHCFGISGIERRKSIWVSTGAAAEISCARAGVCMSLLNMNGTRIAVLGLYRSGSTVVAGVLHHLGVDMGPPFYGGYY